MMRYAAALVVAVAVAAAVAVPAAAMTTTMFANFQTAPLQYLKGTKLVVTGAQEYQCDSNVMTGYGTTYVVATGRVGGCYANPTSYLYDPVPDYDGRDLATLYLKNITAWKRVLMIGAVAFGSDDGKTVCCTTAGLSIPRYANSVFESYGTCKPCQHVPSRPLPSPADVVTNFNAQQLNVDFFDSHALTAQPCDRVRNMASGYIAVPLNRCAGPTKRFALSSLFRTCNITLTAEYDVRAVTVQAGVTPKGTLCADAVVAAIGTANVVNTAQTCPSCAGTGF